MAADGILEVATTPLPKQTLKRLLMRHPSSLCLLVQVLGEGIGSFLLMFYVCGVSMGDVISHGHMSVMEHATAAAFCIMLIIFALGHISGAHVNPAVTLAFASVGKFPWIQVPWYVVGQLVGGIMGTLLAKVLYGVDVNLVLSLPMPGHVGVAFVMELFIAIKFMFLACSVSSSAQVIGLHAAIAMAMCVALSIIIAGPISGASMNPMRSLAPAIVASKYEHLWVYMLAPPLGTVLGAWMHKLLLNLLSLCKQDFVTPLS